MTLGMVAVQFLTLDIQVVGARGIPAPQEVAVAVVSRQEECWVRLMDKASGELFAECPIPRGQPLVTVPPPPPPPARRAHTRSHARQRPYCCTALACRLQ